METSDELAVEHVVRRLHVTFPDLSPEVLRSEVATVYQEFRDAKVRSFLPILVEREVLARRGAPRTYETPAHGGGLDGV